MARVGLGEGAGRGGVGAQGLIAVEGRRYYACESLYNIAKVCKGEILVHFNGIFDALSKVRPWLPPGVVVAAALTLSLLPSRQLSADSEASVKNGAELLDRLLKDIVSETALNYVSRYPENVDRTFTQYHELEHPALGAGGEYGYQARLRVRLAAQAERKAAARRHPLEASPERRPGVLKEVPGDGAREGEAAREKREDGLGVGTGAGPGAGPGARAISRSEGSLTRDPSPNSAVGPAPGSGAGVGGSSVGRSDVPKTSSISGSYASGNAHARRQSQSQQQAPAQSQSQSQPTTSTGPGHFPAASGSGSGAMTQLHAPLTAGHSARGSHSTEVSPHPSIPSASVHADDPTQGRSTSTPAPRLAFSLAKFVPLLSERIYVISPFTRSHLVSWIMVLDSVPDLELVSYLPEFLDGLL